jgi:tryptophanyl-tRNA synthetase
VADWHALTSDYADTSGVAQNTIEIAIDWLAAGLDPEKSTLFVQSAVPEHAELHLLLSMVTPLGWLERVPTYKEALDNIKDKDLHTFGFLGYPVLQTADIVMYGDPETNLVVPVGEDQVSHVELGREIVRRFDFFYGSKLLLALSDSQKMKALEVIVPNLPRGNFESDAKGKFSLILEHARSELGLEKYLQLIREHPEYFTSPDVLSEPEALLTHTPRIPGLDGRKMSKSYGNAINLSESDESIRAKTKLMMTDPARKRRGDPGNPGICPVFDWHKLFSPLKTQEWSAHGCRTAEIGCLDCKKAMADNLIAWIEPIRQRRTDYEQQPDRVLEILDTGSKRARMVAQQTMDRVRDAVFHWPEKRAEIARSGSATPAKNLKAGS